MTRISSYNINCVRAAHRKGLVDWVSESDPDIICFQELRADPKQIPDDIISLPYHKSYHTAEKKGYSGVAIFSKNEPLSIKEGIGVDWIDKEGRVLTAEFADFRVVSVYAPSGTTGDVRQDLKIEFLDAFYQFGSSLVGDKKPTLFCGDFNICHQEIDIHNPDKQHKTSGFLPEERAWISSFLDIGYKDVFRSIHPDVPDLYSWWSYRAASKSRNKGWRIDYHFGSPALASMSKYAVIEKKWDLSDHAPVTIDYEI
jgi:exodeoxyribonuclease-3